MEKARSQNCLHRGEHIDIQLYAKKGIFVLLGIRTALFWEVIFL